MFSITTIIRINRLFFSRISLFVRKQMEESSLVEPLALCGGWRCSRRHGTLRHNRLYLLLFYMDARSLALV
jgi:hypothetical protein